MFNIPKSVQKSCCNEVMRHYEPQAWQSHKANTVCNKESETPLTAVGTLTSLLRNSTKVMDYLSQKIRNYKVVVLTISFFTFSTTESLAAETWNCGYQGGDNVKCTLDDDGVLTVSGKGTLGSLGFDLASRVKIANIEDGITEIGDSAFFWATSLTSVNIPNSVKSIGYGAFMETTSLTFLNIPNSVTFIGKDVFAGASSLTSVNIPDSVTEIGIGAFDGTQIPNCSLSELDKCHLPCTNGTFWNGTACVANTCAEVYAGSSETQCESSVSGCSVTTCSEVGSLADGTKCYKSTTTDHTPNCDSNATLVGEGASCACVCNSGFEGSGTTCTAISCPAGKYLDGSECKTCAAGTYAEAGDNVCSSCGAHEYSAAGASSCLPRQNFSNCNEFSTDSDECTSCKTGYTAENGGCVSMCSDGKVFWDGECYDEYPFAKKRYTPAEADQWLKDDGNIVTLIFKK